MAKALHHVVTQRAVNVKLLLPAEVFSQPNSYAMAFAFLALRRNKLEVKVVAGGKVDPRILVDGKALMVGYPLEGIPEEVKGPLLLFTDEGLIKAERERYNTYWNASPYCRPKVEYVGNTLKTWCQLSKSRY